MKKSNFKIGDRVIVMYHDSEPNAIGQVGTVVAIDEDGDELVKLDEVINSYDYCIFTNYQSDRKDLINIDKRFDEELMLLEDEEI